MATGPSKSAANLAPVGDPAAVTLTARTLDALSAMPDYDIDPLLLRALQDKLAKSQASSKTLAASIAAQRTLLIPLTDAAGAAATQAARADSERATAQHDLAGLVHAAYTAQLPLSPTVTAIFAAGATGPESVLATLGLERRMVGDSSTRLQLAGDALAQTRSTADTAQSVASQAQVKLSAMLATQRRNAASVAADEAAIVARIKSVRSDLASKRATQLVDASAAAARWQQYLAGFSSYGGEPIEAAAAVGTSGVVSAAEPSTETVDAVSFAFAQLGKPYIWGSAGPAGFDCSGLLYAAWHSAGVSDIPRLSWDQYAWSTPVPLGSEMPGDLIFFAGDDGTIAKPGHVGMVIDPARHLMIQAPQTGDVVKVSDYSNWSGFVGFGRVPVS